MTINLAGKKMLIGGIHNCGKTHLAKAISKSFKTIVYTPYPEEWKGEDVILIEPIKDYVNDFSFWCSRVKQFAKAGKVNLFVIDDADIIFKTNFDTSQEARELFIGHRHFRKKETDAGLSLLFVTRRLQDIPAKFYGSIEFLALFVTESPQTIDLLNKIYAGLGDLVKNLQLGSYEFILKEIGKIPAKMKV